MPAAPEWRHGSGIGTEAAALMAGLGATGCRRPDGCLLRLRLAKTRLWHKDSEWRFASVRIWPLFA